MKRSWCFLLVLAWTLTVRGAADGPLAYRIETVAGSAGMGDGGPATMAQIGAIQGIAVDRFGNLYLSDTDHHRIRKVSAAGVISTIAGTGSAGFGGYGGPAAGGGRRGRPPQCALAVRSGSRPRGIGLHRRPWQPPRAPHRPERRDRDRGRHWRQGLVRRWRPGNRGATGHSPQRGGGCRGQPLYLRIRGPSDS